MWKVDLWVGSMPRLAQRFRTRGANVLLRGPQTTLLAGVVKGMGFSHAEFEPNDMRL